MNERLIMLHNVGCVYKIRKSHFRYVSYEALRNINLGIKQGSTLGVIGRNGAGKSTLLKLIAGILKPTSGKVEYYKDISISLLALQLGFSGNLSGRQNAIMGALLLGYSKAEAQDRLGGIIEFSELGEWIDEPVRSYSSGMRARLGFAVAMEMSPDVLLVDEVLGVGDVAFRRKSSLAMKQKMHSGQTTVFVSHSADLHRELSSWIVWIEHGQILKQGKPDDLLKEYQESVNKSEDAKLSVGGKAK